MLPFLASLLMRSQTAVGVMVTHFGAVLLYGSVEAEIPFPFVYILPM